MNFKDYINSNDFSSADNVGENDCSNSGDSIKQVNEKDVKGRVEELVNKYESYSEQELLNEFLKESQKAKANGIYNSDKIDELRTLLSPMLSEEQKDYFEKLVGMLK